MEISWLLVLHSGNSLNQTWANLQKDLAADRVPLVTIAGDEASKVACSKGYSTGSRLSAESESRGSNSMVTAWKVPFARVVCENPAPKGWST